MASDDPDNAPEDKALVNWERWLRVRQKQHEKLGSSLQRSPASLVMNSAEDARYIREEKEILERSKKLIIPDKFRGHPDFWRTPLLLPDEPGLNRYEIKLSKVERGLPVEPLERIGCPLGIKMEKNIIGEVRPTSKDKWKQNEYLAMRKKALRQITDGANDDDDFSPRIEELMVQGHAWKRSPPSENKLDEETMTHTASEEGQIQLDTFFGDRCHFEDCFCNTRCIPKMKVQGLVLQMKPQMCCDKAPTYIPHFFPRERSFVIRLHLNSVVNKNDEVFLRLENMASLKFEFSWIFKKNPITASRAVFFFNKNNDIILPGHIIHFPILFHSRSPGVFIEEWYLKTTPGLLGDTDIIISLWGKADANDFEELEEMAAIESYLQQRLAQTSARETADEMLKRTTFPKTLISRNDNISLFTEQDIFKEINPGFHYHPSVVESLKAMYIEVCGAESGEWDLDLMKFRQKIVETSVDIKQRQSRLEEFNNKVKKLLTAPKIETLDLNAMKYDLGKGIFGHFPCVIEDQTYRLKECFGIKEAASIKMSEAVGDSDVKDALPEDTEAAQSQAQATKTAEYEDTLYKTLYQYLAENMEQVAANIESIKMCNIENK